MFIGYRKFIITSGALLLAFVLALLQRLTPEFATVASIAVGAFSYANTKVHEAKAAESLGVEP